jgi:hypothetical protein
MHSQANRRTPGEHIPIPVAADRTVDHHANGEHRR